MLFILIPFCIGFCVGIWQEIKPYLNRGEYLPPIEEETAYDDEITALELIIERRKKAAFILEKELDNCTDEKRLPGLISKINALDKQTLSDLRKIEKLKGL